MSKMTITVPVEDITGKLTFKQAVGQGEYAGEPVEFMVSLPAYSPLIKYMGKTYLVDISDIIQEVCGETIKGKIVHE